MALSTVAESRWCRRVTPERGSRERSRAGTAYCQSHARAAFKRFRSNAPRRCAGNERRGRRCRRPRLTVHTARNTAATREHVTLRWEQALRASGRISSGLLRISCALGLPVAGLGLAVPFACDFALDRVGGDLAVVFGYHLV